MINLSITQESVDRVLSNDGQVPSAIFIYNMAMQRVDTKSEYLIAVQATRSLNTCSLPTAATNQRSSPTRVQESCRVLQLHC